MAVVEVATLADSTVIVFKKIPIMGLEDVPFRITDYCSKIIMRSVHDHSSIDSCCFLVHEHGIVLPWVSRVYAICTRLQGLCSK